jgi:hypothetical protein
MTAVTANRNIIPLGHSFRFDTENQRAWEDVLTFWKNTYPSLNNGRGVTISDGDKGIAAAHKLVLDLRGKFRCLEHKKQNLMSASGMSADIRGKAITAYMRCNTAMTDAEFATAWASMPPEAHRHFPEPQWPEFFAFKCSQDLHGWYTSSVAESENKSLLDARSLDPFNALLAIVQQCGADRLATKQQTLAIDD